jgi:hypothetical protein
MNKQLLSNKQIPIDICRRLYQSDRRQYSALGMRKLGTERSRQVQTGSISPRLSSQDVRVDDVGCSREPDHERTGKKNCCKFTHDGHDDGNAKMQTAFQTQRNEGVKISEANARCMVSNATTSRETSAGHTTRIRQYPQETRL